MFPAIALGLRALARRPGYVLGVALPLAFGMGASIAIFSVVLNVLVRPLEYPDAGAIASIEQENPHLSAAPLRLSSGNYLRLEKAVRSFRSLAAYESAEVTLTGRGEPVRLAAAAVGRAFFDTLGVFPEVGRPFLPGEFTAPGLERAILARGRAAVLSHELWRSRFQGSREILGQVLTLDGAAHTVVGVMPPRFAFPGRVDVWVPLVFGDVAPDDWGGFYLGVVGRLAEGAAFEPARAELALKAEELRGLAAETNAGLRFSTMPLQEKMTKDLEEPLWVVLILANVILVNVGLNAGHLLLARVVSRERETAVVLALGGRVGAVFRQLLAESLLLTLAALALALVWAHWCLWTLLALAPVELAGFREIGLDGPTLLFAALVAVGSATLCAALPLPGLRSLDVARSLNEGAARGSPGRRQGRIQDWVVGAQTALSLALLVMTALMLRSYSGLASQELNFDPSGVLTLDLTLPEARFGDPDAARGFAERALQELAAAPGVAAAAAGLRFPVLDEGAGIWFRLGEGPGAGSAGGPAEHEATLNTVTPGYFDVLRIPIRRGRGLGEEDRPGGRKVVVVSEELARRHFGGRDPLGKRLVLTPWPEEGWEIVGVAADVKQGGLKASAFPTVYVPFSQLPIPRLRFVVRTSGDPAALSRTAARSIWAVEPDLGFERIAPLEARIGGLLAPERFAASLVALFGGLGLVLAATGIYGSTAYRVSGRRFEFGVRLALGALPRDIVLHEIRAGLPRTLIAVALGVAAAIGAGGLASSILYAVGPLDPLSVAGGALLTCLVALLSMYLPARRASRLDPSAVLRRG
jgi:predicted permease